jgi:hypothetical protein
MVDEVKVKITADGSQVGPAVGKVKKEISSVKDSTDVLSQKLKQFGGILAGAFTVGAITSALRSINSAADQLNDLSTRLGASASGLQTLQIAAQQAGGSAAGMEQALAKLQTTVGQGLAGNKAAAQAFAQLGLSAQELAGLKTDEAMQRISTALSSVQNDFQRASIAQDIFGRGAKELAGFFADAPGALSEVNAKLEQYGAKLNDIDIAKIGVMNDDLAFQSKLVQNLGISFVADLSPAVGVAIDSFQNLLGSMAGVSKSGHLFGTVMTAGIKSIEAAVQGLISWFELWRAAGAKLWQGLTAGASTVLGVLGRTADALGLDMAAALQRASESAAGWSAQFKIGADAAYASAQLAKDAAIQAGLDILRADEIFQAKAAELEARAAAAAARAQASQGALGVGLVPGAAGAAGTAGTAGQPGALLSDQTLAATADATRFDPTLDPKVLQQVQINEALQALEDQHAATMLGKVEAFNATWLGQMLTAGQTQIAVEQSKNLIIGQSMGQLAGMMMNQGGRIGKAGKALAIAQTIWATASAAMQSFQNAGGYPWGIAPAAAVVATGLAQLANIKKTNVGSAGSVAGVSKGGSSGTSPALSNDVPGTGATGQPLTQQSAVQIIVQGSLFAAQETVDWLTDKIAESVRERDVVFIAPSSRQAMELRGT